MAYAAENSAAILNSWKEIAAYLDRGVRTVQRWERDLRLPVHRIGKGNRSPVYASIAELKFWLATSEADTRGEEVRTLLPGELRNERAQQSPARVSHELVAKSQELVRAVAENSVRQQREAELLQKRILLMRARMR